MASARHISWQWHIVESWAIGTEGEEHTYLGVWQHFCFGCFKASAAFAFAFALGVLPRLPPINHVILFSFFSAATAATTTSTTEDKSKLASSSILLHSLYIYQFGTSNTKIKAFLWPIYIALSLRHLTPKHWFLFLLKLPWADTNWTTWPFNHCGGRWIWHCQLAISFSKTSGWIYGQEVKLASFSITFRIHPVSEVFWKHFFEVDSYFCRKKVRKRASWW